VRDRPAEGPDNYVKLRERWCAWQGSNLRPSDSKRGARTPQVRRAQKRARESLIATSGEPTAGNGEKKTPRQVIDLPRGPVAQAGL